ncbi:MAG: hypothetical protein ACLPID_09730 [Beijerinckiaceae bacterium]
MKKRLIAALNHSAEHFIAEQEIRGVTHIPFGLASYIVRGGGKFFDFRSTADLLRKGDAWLGRDSNPFRVLTANDRMYIDVLSAVRNYIVHDSDTSFASYRSHLQKAYNIKAAPAPNEFLNTIDIRALSPWRKHRRIDGLAKVLAGAIQQTSLV